MYTCMHVRTYVYPVCMHACMRVCACMHVCMHVCVYVCMHACVYACMHACMYVCVCMYVCMFIVQAFYSQKLVNLPQIATEANSTDMISWIYPECRVKSPKESFGGKIVKIAKVWCYSNCIFRYFTAFTWLLDWAASAYYARFFGEILTCRALT